MFSPALGDETLFSVVKKNKSTTSTSTCFSDIVKLGKNRFLVGRSKTPVLFQLNEKSIYEIAQKSMKVLSLIPYESIRECEARPNKVFVLNDGEYMSDVNLQIVTEIKQRINSVTDMRQTKLSLLQKHVMSQLQNESELAEGDSNLNSVSSNVPIAGNMKGVPSNIPDSIGSLGSNIGISAELSSFSDESMGSFTPKRDKLSKLLGISKYERLNMEADRIVLDSSTEEGRTCLQYVKDFPTKHANGKPLLEIRTFLDKMKRYIVNKRNENFETLIQSGSLANNVFLGNSAIEIDSDVLEKNNAIEKSLERAILIEPVRKILWNNIYTSLEIKSRDEQLELKLQQILSKQDQNYYQIPEDLQSPTEWLYCTHILHKINGANYPFEMIQIILDTYRSIPKVFQDEHKGKTVTLAADDLLPIMIFVVSRAELQKPLLKMEYILSLMDPLIRSQEEGYAATLFSSALSVLDDMLPEETSSNVIDTNVDDFEITHSLGVSCKSESWKFISPVSSQSIFTQTYVPLNFDDVKGHVICLHDLHEHSGRGKALYERLIQTNYIVHTMDLMGHGLSSGYRGLIESIDALVSDFTVLLSKIQENNLKQLPIFSVGMGIGSSILFHACVNKPDLLAGCCFVAPIFFLNRNYTSLLSPRFLEKFVPKSGLVEFTLSTDAKVLEQFSKDSLSISQKLIVKTGCAILRSQSKIPNLLENFSTPFLFLRAEYDHISDTQNDDQFYDLAPTNDKELLVFPSCHSLLHGSQKLPVINGIQSWILARTIAQQQYSMNSSPHLERIEQLHVIEDKINVQAEYQTEENLKVPDETFGHHSNEVQILDTSKLHESVFEMENDASIISHDDMMNREELSGEQQSNKDASSNVENIECKIEFSEQDVFVHEVESSVDYDEMADHKL